MRSHACAMVCTLVILNTKHLCLHPLLTWVQVEAWKLRGNVPHHVEATALLTDAILHDDALHNSIFSIRATYSAAFCRYAFPIF